MIRYCVLTIFCNLLFYAVADFLGKRTGESVGGSHWKKCGLVTALEVVLLVAVWWFTHTFMGARNLPGMGLPLLVTELLIGLGTAFSNRETTSRLRQYLRKAAWIAGVMFLLESLVFHFPSFSTHRETTDLPLSQAEISDASAAQVSGDTIQISGNCTLTFSNLEQSADIRYLTLLMDGEDVYYNVTCSMKDENLSNQFEQVGKTQATATSFSLRFAMLPYQTLHAIQLQFTEVDAPLVLHSGIFHTAMPYHFSSARFFLVLLLALLLTACKQFHIWNIRYRAHSWKHNLSVLATLFGCMVSVLAFRVPDLEATTLNDPIDINNVYAMTLEAWEKGQVYMDFEPSEERLSLENPYDNSVREFYFDWDYAFYNGKYYCYFGCAPVVLLYVPYYELTGNVLPLNWAYCIMTEAVIVTLFGLILTLVRKFCKRPPLILLLLGLVSAVAGSGVLFGLNYSDRYHLCILTGMFGLFLSLWMGFAAMDSSYAVRTTKQLRKLSLQRAKKDNGEHPEQEEIPMPVSPYTVKKRGNWKRFVLLAVSAIGTVITAASRPNMLLYVLILVPVFLQYLLFRKDLKLSAKLTSAACYLIPVAAGAAAIMWYNKIRFDDPFQFGSIYQMTVDNTAANKITLSRLPAAIGTYFFSGLERLNDFPFLRTKYVTIANRQMYLYGESTMGAFALPSVLLGAFSIPFVWNRWKRQNSCMLRRVVLACTAVAVVLLAWIDFCMAGILLRYMLDILVILSVFSTILLLQVPALLKSYHAGLARVSEKVIAAAMVGTVLVCLCILITSGEKVSLFKAHPTIWNTWKEIFVFWR